MKSMLKCIILVLPFLCNCNHKSEMKHAVYDETNGITIVASEDSLVIHHHYKQVAKLKYLEVPSAKSNYDPQKLTLYVHRESFSINDSSAVRRLLSQIANYELNAVIKGFSYDTPSINIEVDSSKSFEPFFATVFDLTYRSFLAKKPKQYFSIAINRVPIKEDPMFHSDRKDRHVRIFISERNSAITVYSPEIAQTFALSDSASLQDAKDAISSYFMKLSPLEAKNGKGPRYTLIHIDEQMHAGLSVSEVLQFTDSFKNTNPRIAFNRK